MAVAASSRSKILYKAFILYIKYAPILISCCYVLNTLALYFKQGIEPLSNLSGVSVITWGSLYIASTLLQFCIYHRLLLWYIFIDDCINIIEYYCYIPVKIDELFMVLNILMGIFLFIMLRIHLKERRYAFYKLRL